MTPVHQLTAAQKAAVRFILMDIDDTLTRDGKLSAAAYASLWDLHGAGFRVIPVTGRPAGWCDLIAREWPVDGVIGENGALAFWEERPEGGRPILRQEFHPHAIKNNSPTLARLWERARAEVPGLRVAKDQFSRMFDLALDFAEEEPALSLADAERVRALAVEAGLFARVSSIHVNVWAGDYDKLSMAERFLRRRFGWTGGADDGQVVFVGDSPNDEPMFARFPLSCAVANIHRYRGLISRYPAFVAEKECGEGFAEIAALFCGKA
ncbi:MAG: HAD-IIB family hydrolase [Spirochaetaceae bacterium]|jgi:HAD superfamily hydrolase (TIGR01484 family)|nr:HAD-IIB family hydrolase [Spirochaetaceae bacterium]